jgi:large subunit ribosomal protein L10
VAKALRDYARTNPTLVVKGGLLGTKVLTAAEVSALADLPPRETVLAQLAGALQAPMAQLASLLAALPRNFAYGLQALIDQRGGAPADAGAAAEPAETAEPAEAADASPAAEPAEAADAADAGTASEPSPVEATEPAAETPSPEPTASAEEE